MGVADARCSIEQGRWCRMFVVVVTVQLFEFYLRSFFLVYDNADAMVLRGLAWPYRPCVLSLTSLTFPSPHTPKTWYQIILTFNIKIMAQSTTWGINRVHFIADHKDDTILTQAKRDCHVLLYYMCVLYGQSLPHDPLAVPLEIIGWRSWSCVWSNRSIPLPTEGGRRISSVGLVRMWTWMSPPCLTAWVC